MTPFDSQRLAANDAADAHLYDERDKGYMREWFADAQDARTQTGFFPTCGLCLRPIEDMGLCGRCGPLVDPDVDGETW